MKRQIKELAARTLCATGIPWLARRQLDGQLAILMFHGVETRPLSPSCPYIVDAATLRRELRFLRRKFNVLSLEEALRRLSDGTLPKRAATLTFDDGTRNLATHAAPILRELGLPAAVFLATGPMGTQQTLWPDRLWLGFANTELSEVDLSGAGLGKHSLVDADDRAAAWRKTVGHLKSLPDSERLDRLEWVIRTLGPHVDADPGPFEMLSWDEARSLSRDSGVSLYPHTVTHPILSRCTDEKVDYEISESCRVLERETGQAPSIFAYPNGHITDFDERAKAALTRNGVRWALSTTNGFANRHSDPFALPRIGFSLDQSSAIFRLKVSGAQLLRRSSRAAAIS